MSHSDAKIKTRGRYKTKARKLSPYYAANKERLLARAKMIRAGLHVPRKQRPKLPEAERMERYRASFKKWNDKTQSRIVENRQLAMAQTRAVFAPRFGLIVRLLEVINEERLIKQRAKNKRLRAASPEIYRRHSKRCRIANKDSYNAARRTERVREMENARKRRDISKLSDRYIKKLLTQNTSLKAAHIPRELIEVKRLQLSLKREVETKTQ